MRSLHALSCLQGLALVCGCSSAAPSTSAAGTTQTVAHEVPSEPAPSLEQSPITEIVLVQDTERDGLTLTSVTAGASLSSDGDAVVVPRHGCAAAGGYAWALEEIVPGTPASARLRRLRIDAAPVDASDLEPHEIGVGVSARALDRDVLVRVVEPQPDGSARVALRVSGGDSPGDLEYRMTRDSEVRIAVTRESYAAFTLATAPDALGCTRVQARFVDRTRQIAAPADGVDTVLLEGMGIRRGASTLHFDGLTYRRSSRGPRLPLVTFRTTASFQDTRDEDRLQCEQGSPCLHGELSIEIVGTGATSGSTTVTVRLLERP